MVIRMILFKSPYLNQHIHILKIQLAVPYLQYIEH